jgi:cysteinyl-tRNA synthetase
MGTAAGLTGHGGFADGAPTDAPLPDRAGSPFAPLSDAGRELHDRFVAAIDDDLDLPTALAVTREVLRAAVSADERRWLILDADAVLGLDLDRVWEAEPTRAVPSDVEALVADRIAARSVRDFDRADALRDELAARGWDVVDGPEGSVVQPRART